MRILRFCNAQSKRDQQSCRVWLQFLAHAEAVFTLQARRARKLQRSRQTGKPRPPLPRSATLHASARLAANLPVVPAVVLRFQTAWSSLLCWRAVLSLFMHEEIDIDHELLGPQIDSSAV